MTSNKPIFNSLAPQIVLQEVPGEVSLLFTISGCQLNCKGCHSPEIHDPHYGSPLTFERFKQQLKKYQGMVSCILFFGGEWQKNTLIELLMYAQQQGFKTCLYSGKDSLPKSILAQLNYVKLGKWQPELGGLDAPNSNQKFIDLLSGNLLNERFHLSN